MGAFFAQDQPGPVGPVAHVDRRGGFGDPGAVADAAARFDRRIPAVALVEGFRRVANPGVDGVAEGEPHPDRPAGVGEGVGGTGGIATHQNLWPTPIVGGGSVGRRQRLQRPLQHLDVAAVLEPALPGRSSPANASPPAISERSKNASSEW